MALGQCMIGVRCDAIRFEARRRRMMSLARAPRPHATRQPLAGRLAARLLAIIRVPRRPRPTAHTRGHCAQQSGRSFNAGSRVFDARTRGCARPEGTPPEELVLGRA